MKGRGFFSRACASRTSFTQATGTRLAAFHVLAGKNGLKRLRRPSSLSSLQNISINTIRLPPHVWSRNFVVSSPLSDVVPFNLADIGEGIAEVEVLQWFVKEGDRIEQFDKVCEVQSDKANVEITSRYAGRVGRLYYNVGDIAHVGSPLIDIVTDGDGENTAAPSPEAKAATSTGTAAASTAGNGQGDSIVEFKLADIGEGIAEVELLQWFVREGQPIKQFDRVCEVQSDKATVEITSRYDGVVQKLHWVEGSQVPVGSTLINISVEGDVSSAGSTGTGASAPSANAASPSSTTSSSGFDPDAVRHLEKVLTTPSVRRIAKENNVDLRKVPGTGPKGRILKGDVLNYLASLKAPSNEAAQQHTSSPAPLPRASEAAISWPTAGVAAPIAPPIAAPAASIGSAPAPPVASLPTRRSLLQEDETVPLRGIQRMMVKSMTEALKVPHFHYGDEITLDNLVELRKRLKKAAADHGVKLTYLPFLVKAASLALIQFPTLNATVNSECTELKLHKDHNISLAVDTPRGLLVPNVKQVQHRSIIDIAKEIARLQALGQAGKLSEYDLNGGTFSLSNIGAIGGTVMGPVIMVPQVAIGAVGKVQVLPRFDTNGQVKASHIMNVSWGGDHRVLDGATMARFSNLWKSYLEDPITMLAELR